MQTTPKDKPPVPLPKRLIYIYIVLTLLYLVLFYRLNWLNFRAATPPNYLPWLLFAGALAAIPPLFLLLRKLARIIQPQPPTPSRLITYRMSAGILLLILPAMYCAGFDLQHAMATLYDRIGLTDAVYAPGVSAGEAGLVLVGVLTTSGLFLMLLGSSKFKSPSTVGKFLLASILAVVFTYLFSILNFGQTYQF